MEITQLFSKVLDKEDIPEVHKEFRSLISGYTNDEEATFSTFVARSLDADKLTPMTAKHRHSSSVIDVFSLFTQNIPVMFSLSEPSLCEFFAGTMGGTFNRIIIKYAEMLLTHTQYRTDLYPLSANGGKKFLGKRGPFPPIPPHVADIVVLQTEEQLTVIINNLNFILKSIFKLKKELTNTAAQHNLKIESDFWDSIFITSQRTVEEGLREASRYFACRMVFMDLREAYIEGLYNPASPHYQVKIHGVLEYLENHLPDVKSMVDDDVVSDVMTWIFREMVDGFEYILLYGGNDRRFEPKDAESLMQDLLEMQKFFIAKDKSGEIKGISEQVVIGYSSRVKTIIANLMEYSSDSLIELFESAKSSNEVMEVQSKQNIMCVLFHRNDKNAKAFIKTHKKNEVYKLTKRGNNVLLQMDIQNKRN
eukprot:TRINITY_DN4416_c0_g1_i3.p1 TRINITY_DN4416_c0_g1~~TRINITY_DN4416_c0_g1_i3.p1  ORF type:complete len:421 (-),score=161.63 TRINITY_DN4416_c0_g1_i3:48-1310(-)